MKKKNSLSDTLIILIDYSDSDIKGTVRKSDLTNTKVQNSVSEQDVLNIQNTSLLKSENTFLSST